MKNLYSLIAVAGAGFILISIYANSGGPAQNGNTATGAPGDGGTTCVSCHNNTGTFGTVSLDLHLVSAAGDTVTEYNGDSAYTVHVTVNNSAGTPAGYGFQMTNLIDSDDGNYNGWANPSANAQLSSTSGKNYVEHSGMSNTNTFSVGWTAPAAGNGSVTFYVGGNAVNGNGSNNGDRAAIDQFTYNEITTDTSANGLNDLAKTSLKVYPNPATNIIHLEDFEGQQVRLVNAMGQWTTLDVNQGTADVSRLAAGHYFLMSDDGQQLSSFIKQ